MIPGPFLQRLQAIIPPDHWPRVRESFAAPQAFTVRVNPRRLTPEQAITALARAGIPAVSLAMVPGVLLIPPGYRAQVTRHELVDAGALYPQNPSSLLPVVALDPQPGERVLDLCAAPGGKTLAMAERMGDAGELVAVEAVKPRFFKLLALVKQAGAGDRVRCQLMDGGQAGRRWPEAFQRVLVDAPCSSEARFHESDPESYRYWSPRKSRDMAGKQKALLNAGWAALAPGGSLVYATCSFAPEENESVIAHFLGKMGQGARVAAVSLPEGVTWQPGLAEWQGKSLPPELAQARRILPDGVMEGFFFCLLRKPGGGRVVRW